MAVGAIACEAANNVIINVNAEVHLACFDLSAKVMDMIELGDVAFTIDPQQRLQGYMPVIVLHLWNTNAGILPGTNIASGPGFVDKSNVVTVASQAGINR
jgi:simple sugar transport system substrate-binding protein